MIYKYLDKTPEFASPFNGWIADTARVIGDVYLGHQASIWFGAVIRGKHNFDRYNSRADEFRAFCCFDHCFDTLNGESQRQTPMDLRSGITSKTKLPQQKWPHLQKM